MAKLKSIVTDRYLKMFCSVLQSCLGRINITIKLEKEWRKRELSK